MRFTDLTTLIILGLLTYYLVLGGEIPYIDIDWGNSVPDTGETDDWSDETGDPDTSGEPEATVEFEWGVSGSGTSSVWVVESGKELEPGYVELFVQATVTVSNAGSVGDMSFTVQPVGASSHSSISTALHEITGTSSFTTSGSNFVATITETYATWNGLDYTDLGIPNVGDEQALQMKASVSAYANPVGGGSKFLSISNSYSPNSLTFRHTSEPTIDIEWGGTGAQD